MVSNLDAQIVPVIFSIDGRAGLTLWAPGWAGTDGELMEGFVGHEDEVAVFASAADLHAFVHRQVRQDLDSHPAWPGILRRTADQLRAAPSDVVDFDSVYDLAAQPRDGGAIGGIAKVVRLADAIAAGCRDTELADSIDSSDYGQLLTAPSAFGGRAGRRNWAHLTGEIASSWEWVLERVRSHLAWEGDFTHPDTDAIRQPPVGSYAFAATATGEYTPEYAPSEPAAGHAWAPAARDDSRSALATAEFVQQQPGARSRPVPSLGIIWFNIVALGWALGLGLIYGYFKAIQGVRAMRSRGLSPMKYVWPMLFWPALIVALAVVAAVA